MPPFQILVKWLMSHIRTVHTACTGMYNYISQLVVGMWWVFQFPVPLSFLTYRHLTLFLKSCGFTLSQELHEGDSFPTAAQEHHSLWTLARRLKHHVICKLFFFSAVIIQCQWYGSKNTMSNVQNSKNNNEELLHLIVVVMVVRWVA